MAMMPPALGLLKADKAVFFTTPLRDPMMTKRLSSNSLTARSAAIRSPSSIETRFAIDLPFPPGPTSGISWTFSQYARPRSEKIMMYAWRRSDEEMADEIFVPRPHADATLAAAALIAICRDRGALDVAGVADGDRHVLIGNQILDVDLTARVDDLRAAVVAVLVADSPSARPR